MASHREDVSPEVHVQDSCAEPTNDILLWESVQEERKNNLRRNCDYLVRSGELQKWFSLNDSPEEEVR